MPVLNISDKTISNDSEAFIIAELSANHNQDFDVAVKSIHAIKESGADAAKVQTYTPDTMTIDCGNEYFKIKQDTIWDGKTLYELYEEAYTPWEWQPKLKKIAEDLGLIFFSTPFDKTAVDFLEKMNVPCYKIASLEITDTPLIEYVASKGKPVIISTGIAELQDIDNAVDACKKAGNDQIALLKCTSTYPAPVDEANLATIPDLVKRFNCISGLSDHTLGISVPVTSVALGAKIIEKHFILDKELGGPDAAFSIDKNEFKEMVKSVREAEQAIGKVTYELSEKVKRNRTFSRSLFVVKDIKKGEEFTSDNVKSIRPGYGLSPGYIQDVIGSIATKNLKAGTPLEQDHY